MALAAMTIVWLFAALTVISRKKAEEKRMMVKRLSRALYLGLILILAGCGSETVLPDEVNMGNMTGHDHAHSTSYTGPTTSCTELQDPVTDAAVREFHFTAQKEKIELDNDKTEQAWTFNGTSPGPDIRIKEGERLVVKLTNKDIDAGVTIHWHGVVLPCSQDGVAGVTQDAVKPGEEFTYSFIARYPGTYWYHSHQQSSIQARKGLIGRLIIEPRESSYSYDYDHAITLQRLNSVYLINGMTEDIQLDADPGDTVRLRILNADSRTHHMNVAGAPFRVIAIDGQDLNEPEIIENQSLPIGGGQRYDILFEMPDDGTVQVASRERRRLSVTVGAGEPPQDRVRKVFDFSPYGSPKEDQLSGVDSFDQNHELILDRRSGNYTINGKAHHEIPPIVVKEGEIVKMLIRNEGGGDHPMHLHGHTFKVLSKNGKPLTGSPVYMDTLLIQHKESYEIAFIADNPGLWMKHCHNLTHAERGMSMMVNYEGITTPFTVGKKSGNLPD